MDILEFREQIKKNQLNKLYIITGIEVKVQSIYVHKLSEISNKRIQFIDAVSDIYKRSGGTLFSESYVYVCMEDDDFYRSEKAWDNVTDVIGDNILVLWYSNIDKRSKFYKHFKDTTCDFQPLKPEILKKHIKSEIDLSDTNIDRLMEICEYDYGRCLLEIDKVKRFDHEATNSAFEHLMQCGAIYTPPKNAIFELSDAVLGRDVNKSFRLLEELETLNEVPLKILSVLYNGFKRLLQVQSCPKGDVAQITGLSDWEIRNARNFVDRYEIWELVDALKVIRQTEVSFKQGLIDESLLVQYVLVNIL